LFKKGLIQTTAAMLMLALALSAPPAAAAGDFTVKGVSAASGGMSVIVGNSAGGWSKLGYTVYQKQSVVAQGFVPYGGGSSAYLPVPTSQFASDVYRVSVWGSSSDGSVTSEFFSFDVPMGNNIEASSVNVLPYSFTDRHAFFRSVTVPYADVFETASMTSVKKTLRRFERVYTYPTTHPQIVYAEYYYLPEGEEPEYGDDPGDTRWEYITNLRWGSGYMYKSAIRSEVFGRDAVREFVEYCYSRIGTKGVYNQNRRFDDFYSDCSSLVWNAANHIGINMGGATTADDEATYMSAHSSAVVYSTLDTLKNPPVMLYERVGESYKPRPRWKLIKLPVKDGTSPAVPGVREKDITELLEPGDTVHYSYTKEAYYMDPEDGPTYWGRVIDVEEGSSYGIDHVSVYIGDNKIIHSSDRGKNTLIVNVRDVDLTSVIFVGRPVNLL
jgi:cell wall-associated NlpC family hydrolase